VDWIVWKS
jgi:hypothetical protein